MDTLNLLGYVLVLGIAGYAGGRLLAQDTVLDPVRIPFLRFVGGRKPMPEIVAMERAGIQAEYEWPDSPIRRYLLDGLTCPSCLGFWVTLAAHLGLGLWPAPWREDVLVVAAAWGICGTFVRIAR